MRRSDHTTVLPGACRWLVCLSAILFVTACSSNQSSSPPTPPSMPGGLPSPMPSPPSPPSSPSSAPSSPSSAPSSPSSAPSSPAGSPPSGSPPSGGDSGGQGQPSSYEDLPAPGGPPGAPSGGSPGRTDPGTPSGADGSGPAEPSWEQGLPGGGGGDGDDGWQTSNQLPGAGGTSRIPPMPSERDRRRGTPGDEVLDGALEDFDGEILAEREVIRSRSNETAGTGGAGAHQTGGDATSGLPGTETEGGASRTGTVADAPPMPGGGSSIPSSRGQSTPQPPSAVGRVPDDIPDARDDDIIARQLREAAMAETDPALKERLWDEYRRYKGI